MTKCFGVSFLGGFNKKMIVIFIIIQIMVGPADTFFSLVLTNDCCLLSFGLLLFL